MTNQAHVTSVEALNAFRSTLINYVSKARPTLEEVSGDVLRTRVWLQIDQRLHWENQVRRHSLEMERAQAALSSARMSSFREASTVEQMAVRKAKHALDEAEAKLRILKHWNREFDSRVDPLVKQLEKLHTVLSNDMVKASAYLAEAIKTLAAYAEMAPPSIVTDSAAPASQNSLEAIAATKSESSGSPGGNS